MVQAAASDGLRVVVALGEGVVVAVALGEGDLVSEIEGSLGTALCSVAPLVTKAARSTTGIAINARSPTHGGVGFPSPGSAELALDE